MSDVVLLSGSGPYADAWHDFPETSARLAGILEGIGYTVRITGNVEPELADPGLCRLLVVNIGNPSDPRPPELIEAARAGIEAYVSAGGAILGVHSSATSMTTMPQWPAILGGRWVRGQSMHPPQGESVITLTDAVHPITQGLADFAVFDERYSYLQTQPDVTVLFEHTHDGRRHPLVWARQADRSRVVYDGLGHASASYDSPGHVELIRRAVRWLLREL
jgi:type 1 glutamine amidotransferase